MTDVVVFHHAQGLTPGVIGFAEELRGAGHTVYAPDLYEGHTFDTLGAGLAHLSEIGVEEIVARGTRAVAELPADVVHVGFSLGVVTAQKLAQTHSGARGVVLVSACVPASYFGPWPAGVPVRVHAMEADPVFRDEGDAEAARALVDEVPDAELHLYPGEQHNFADSSLSSYDAAAATLLIRRTLAFLDER